MEKLCAKCGQVFQAKRRALLYCSYSCSNAVTAAAREDRKLDGTVSASVWSCGGGVQSTAIAILIIQGKLPKPDYAIMTDVSHEKQETWEYVHGHLRPRLEEIGVRLEIIPTADYIDPSVLEPTGFVRIPAFKRGVEGETIKFQTHCSGLWKASVSRRWLRQKGVKRASNWIGISADEKRRARTSTLRWIELRYPLIDLGITREDCLWLISNAGWVRPPRTSCHLCPLQTDSSWLRTKQHYPDDWALAVAAERKIQEQNPDVYLHKSLVPLNDVKFEPTWKELMTECETPGVQ